MLLFALLKELVHLIFELLAKGVHFILLLLHQLGLCSEDLLMPRLHVCLAFLLLNFICSLLNLVSFLVVLLLRQILLNLSHVE